MKTAILLVTLLACSLVGRVHAETAETLQHRVVSPFKRVARWAKDETELLRSGVYNHTHLSVAEKAQVQQCVDRITNIVEQIHDEEVKLENLHAERSALVWEHPTWMFDGKLRKKHRELSHTILKEERMLYNIQEDIHYEMDNIKGLVGIYSWMFVVDLIMTILSPLINTFQFMLNTFYSSLFLFLFAFFPLLFSTLLFFLELRRAIVPVYLTVHFALVAFELPSMVVKYEPNAVELCCIIVISLQILGLVASKLLIPRVYMFVDDDTDSKQKRE